MSTPKKDNSSSVLKISLINRESPITSRILFSEPFAKSPNGTLKPTFSLAQRISPGIKSSKDLRSGYLLNPSRLDLPQVKNNLIQEHQFQGRAIGFPQNSTSHYSHPPAITGTVSTDNSFNILILSRSVLNFCSTNGDA